MRTLLVICSLLLVVLVGNIVLLLRQPVRSPTVKPSENREASLPVRSAPLPPTVDARPQIRQLVEEKRPQLHTTGDVARYLDDLKVQARRNRQVTALEVETGVAAIREHDSQNATTRVFEFRREMMLLSAELEHRDLNADNRPAGLPQLPSLN